MIIVVWFISIIELMLFHFHLSEQGRASEDIACIGKNSWDSIFTSTKTISDPTLCTTVSSSCCYVDLKYNYGNHLMDSQFCFTMSGSIQAMTTYLYNLFTDDLLFYLNYTYYNYDQLDNIGHNLEESYYKDYSCFQPSEEVEFSTYMTKHCAKFNNNSECIMLNDDDYFNKFAEVLYFNVTDTYCNKKDDKGNCIMYNGPDANNTSLEPLLEIIAGELDVDLDRATLNTTIAVSANSQSNTASLQSKWPIQCKLRPKVEVKLICPSNYVKSQYLVVNSLYFLFLFVSIMID